MPQQKISAQGEYGVVRITLTDGPAKGTVTTMSSDDARRLGEVLIACADDAETPIALVRFENK